MIAFDATAQGKVLGATSLSYSHTCTGSNLILFVGINLFNPGSDLVTGVTYGGVALTQLTKQNAQGSEVYLYYLIAPTTGANNIVISTSSSVDIRSISASYTGVIQITSIDNSTVNNANASTITTSLTTINNNCWMISFIADSTARIPSAGTGVTSRNTNADVSNLGDSNGNITPAGSYSMTWNDTGTAGLNVVQASFIPVVVPIGYSNPNSSQPIIGYNIKTF